MVSIRTMLVCLFSFLIILSQVPSAIAAPPDNELNQYLTEIGWTKEEFLDYLAYYEVPLDDFSTVEELKQIMGSPVNPDNLQQTLTKYNLTDPELKELMQQFGDSLVYHKFIEDLDAAIDFYVKHDEFWNEVGSELAAIGLTVEEAETLYTYLTQVEEDNKGQLDQLHAIHTRLAKFLNVDQSSELTAEEVDELVQIFEESMAAYEIKVKFAINQKDVTLQELLDMKKAPDQLYASIYTWAGERIADMSISRDIFQTMAIVNVAEGIIQVGELSNEYVDHVHQKKYEQAEQRFK